jgi:hypothetical protein
MNNESKMDMNNLSPLSRARVKTIRLEKKRPIGLIAAYYTVFIDKRQYIFSRK